MNKSPSAYIFHILLKLRHLLLRVDVAQVLLDHFSILLELRDGLSVKMQK